MASVTLRFLYKIVTITSTLFNFLIKNSCILVAYLLNYNCQRAEKKEQIMAKYYKAIKRKFFNYDSQQEEYGMFIARGEWADGHLAYSRLDENGDVIEDDECMYFQVRSYDGLFMERV